MLRDSGLKGQRCVRERTRQSDKAAKDRAEFLKEVEKIQAAGRPPNT